MSIDDYLVICAGPPPGPSDAQVTLAEFTSAMGEFTERLEAVEPPEEVSDWHHAVLAYQRAVKKALDGAPGPENDEAETYYILDVVYPVGLQHQPAISEAIMSMDPDLVARMLAAGCLGDDGSKAGGTVITEFASISSGRDHTCGVGIDGNVACWGDDFFGRSTPPPGEFISVDAESHTCGVRIDGSVACWGGGGNAKETMPPEGEFTSVTAGADHTCGLRTDGSVACWGEDKFGQSLPPAGEFVSISAGERHNCGVRTDGAVACWGGPIASGVHKGEPRNEALPPEGEFVSVTAGGFTTCGIRSDGTVACWGSSDQGELSPPEGGFTSVSAGPQHVCGVRTDGTVACWGYDSYGQSSPPEGEFVAVSAGDYHTCGIRADASAVCWGDDSEGQASPPTAE